MTKLLAGLPLLFITVLLINACNSSMKNNSSNNATNSNVVADGATPQLISDQFSFTEGPAVDKYGNVFFTDQPNDKIWKYDTEGKLSVFMDKTGRSNGMYFDKAGNLVTCADEKNEIWSITPDKKVTVLLSTYDGKKLNGPNDLWIPANGGIYFTDPYYQRPWWTRKKPEIEGQKVYFLPKGATRPTVIADNLEQPNGIIGTPNGKTLYVADIKANKTYKYTIAEDGSLQNQQLFADLGSDGMTIDSKGNLYLTGKGVTVFNPKGEKLLNIPIPAGWTANVCFAGKNRNQLFITASKGVYILNMAVKGVK